ncbi:hypothetical protein RF11_05559 [Thelohanellus kitauei]|uniref:Tc1-like transposase DDE domain-containing protein n=1 Tax=Thelohanellus kitauei TaxID=669202 RepID=A0A0C2JDU8_THEKT|nr:hypothetical protein RF11_05559 [Thelohanellus kitauei]
MADIFCKIGFSDQTRPYKLKTSVTDPGKAGKLAFFKGQDAQINEVHFCGYIMEACEQLFFIGIHDYIFIMDNVWFHKTNRVQTMLQGKGRRVIYLPPYSPFVNQFENSLPKWKNIVKPASIRSKTDLFNQVAE